ncbi:unnamed protein product [Sympodiomycopsis kandeliae]
MQSHRRVVAVFCLCACTWFAATVSLPFGLRTFSLQPAHKPAEPFSRWPSLPSRSFKSTISYVGSKVKSCCKAACCGSNSGNLLQSYPHMKLGGHSSGASQKSASSGSSLQLSSLHSSDRPKSSTGPLKMGSNTASPAAAQRLAQLARPSAASTSTSTSTSDGTGKGKGIKASSPAHFSASTSPVWRHHSEAGTSGTKAPGLPDPQTAQQLSKQYWQDLVLSKEDMTPIRLVCSLADGSERKVIVSVSDYSALVTSAASKLGCGAPSVVIEIKDGEELWEIDETYWLAIQPGETLYAKVSRVGSSTSVTPAPTTSAPVTAPSNIQIKQEASGGPANVSTAQSNRENATSSTRSILPPARSARHSRNRGNASDGGESSYHSSSDVSSAAVENSITTPPLPRSPHHQNKRRRSDGQDASSSRQRNSGPQRSNTVSPGSRAGPSVRGAAKGSAAAATTSTGPPSSRPARAAKRSNTRAAWNLSLVAPTKKGSRRTWSGKEDSMLWEKLRLEMARRKREEIPIITQREIFETIEAEHGTNGTKTRALIGRNASALATRARQRVHDAVADHCPVPTELLALFKYRKVQAPVPSTQPKKTQDKSLVHQQRADGNRRFGMASMMIGGRNGSGPSSTSATTNGLRTSELNAGPSDRSATTTTVVVRDSSDEEDYGGNESEWQSDVPQPNEAESNDDDSDAEAAVRSALGSNEPRDKRNLSRVQRMWGGQMVQSTEYNGSNEQGVGRGRSL